MSVSLIVIRIEIEDGYPEENLKYLHYEAPDIKPPVEYEYTIMEDGDEGRPDDPATGSFTPRCKTANEVNRGQRVYTELTVETHIADASSLSYANMVKRRVSSTNDERPHGETITPSVSPRDAHRSRHGSNDVFDSPESASTTHGDETHSTSPLEGVYTRHTPRPKSTTHRMSPALHYFSGNPSVEVTKGILHLYKDNNMVTLDEDVPRSDMVCILSVPATHTIHDLIQFIASVNFGIEYMRIIRDTKPNNYMVLIKFHDQPLADEFFTNYNNIPFNSIENYVCHLVYVARVETIKAAEGASLPVPGLTELPNCPVCLERMDESVDGILTILCNHSFHISCLTQWPDTTCPVCRYTQTPEQTAESNCHECGSHESLWICLICGHVGCGRYVGMHAYRHFQRTHHCYSMHLGNNHVWDYAGDNYVHRLVQNKADGKLVEVDEGGNVMREEKLDSLNLEYTYLLTSQLESQRMYFEEKMNKIEENAEKEVENLKMAYERQNTEFSGLQKNVADLAKEKQILEKKCSQLHGRLTKVLNELQEEQQLNKCLMDNQRAWQDQVYQLQNQVRDTTDTKDTEVKELREQLRDIMFHIEAKQQLSTTDVATREEVQEAELSVGAAATSATSRKTRKKGR